MASDGNRPGFRRMMELPVTGPGPGEARQDAGKTLDLAEEAEQAWDSRIREEVVSAASAGRAKGWALVRE